MVPYTNPQRDPPCMYSCCLYQTKEAVKAISSRKKMRRQRAPERAIGKACSLCSATPHRQEYLCHIQQRRCKSSVYVAQTLLSVPSRLGDNRPLIRVPDRLTVPLA